jgi:hypothetical protein
VLVPCSLWGSGGFELRHGHETCAEQLDREYKAAEMRIRSTLERGDPKLSRQVIAEHRAKHKKDQAQLDRMWSESAQARIEQELDMTGGAELEALKAVCVYRCRNLQEAAIRAEYLLTTSYVRDTWDDHEKALLQSFVEEQST